MLSQTLVRTVCLAAAVLSLHASNIPVPDVVPQPHDPINNTTQPAGVTAFDSGVWQLTVLHFNDFHNRMEPADAGGTLCGAGWISQGHCSGGIARMKTVVAQERAKDSDLLLLNAGDDLVGTTWDRFRAGNGVPARFINMLAPDAWTLGNHEFDWGPDTLLQYVQQLQHPSLSCNADFHGHALKDKVSCYTVKYVKGHKVCIFGLTTEATMNSNHSKPWPVTIESAYEAGKKVAYNLHNNEKCQAIILLSHLGYTADIFAAQLIPYLDIVVGGHSHSLLYSGSTTPTFDYGGDGKRLTDVSWGSYPTWQTNPQTGKRVAIVQAGWGSRYMGKLIAQFDGNGGGLVNAWGSAIVLGAKNSDNPVEPDGFVADEVKKLRNW